MAMQMKVCLTTKHTALVNYYECKENNNLHLTGIICTSEENFASCEFISKSSTRSNDTNKIKID